MRNDEAERTRGIRDRKEKKRADKEMARLHAQCAVPAFLLPQAAFPCPSLALNLHGSITICMFSVAAMLACVGV